MEVEAGNENMKFETGPFSFYGVMALSAPTLGESLISPLLSSLSGFASAATYWHNVRTHQKPLKIPQDDIKINFVEFIQLYSMFIQCN